MNPVPTVTPYKPNSSPFVDINDLDGVTARHRQLIGPQWRFNKKDEFWTAMKEEMRRRRYPHPSDVPLEPFQFHSTWHSMYLSGLKELRHFRWAHELAHFVVAPLEHLFDPFWGYPIFTFDLEQPFNEENADTEIEVFIVENLIHDYVNLGEWDWRVQDRAAIDAARQLLNYFYFKRPGDGSVSIYSYLYDRALAKAKEWDYARLLHTIDHKNNYVKEHANDPR